mgnify:CR=1 FL=1
MSRFYVFRPGVTVGVCRECGHEYRRTNKNQLYCCKRCKQESNKRAQREKSAIGEKALHGFRHRNIAFGEVGRDRYASGKEQPNG